MRANQRKKVNKITRISNGMGGFSTRKEKINEIFQKFFADLFSSKLIHGTKEALSLVQRRVTNEMNYSLTKFFYNVGG